MRSVSRLTFLWAMWISLSASAQAWTPKDRLCRALLISTQNRPVDTDGVANQFNKVQRIDGLPREVSKQIENALQLAPHSEVLAALVLEGEEAIAEYFGALEDEKVRVGVPVKKVSLLGRSGSGQFLGSIALGGWAVYTSVATLVATGLSYFAHADFLTTAIVSNAPGASSSEE